jgi:hypothetical protein
MKQLTAWRWRPVVTGGRMPFVECYECHARQLNETNRLHRQHWLESTGGRRHLFVCGECAAQSSRGVSE